MSDEMDTRIREALRAEAQGIEVPDDLGDRTLQAAREAASPGLVERIKAWRDARRMQTRVGGWYPRLAYAAGGVATAVLLFAVGTLVSQPVDLAEPAQVDDAAQTGDASGRTAEEDAPAATPGAIDQESAAGLAVAPEPGLIQPPIPGRPGTFPPAIVETVNLDVEVDDFEESWREANEIAGRYDGFVTDSRTSMDDETASGSLTVRVPSQELESALSDFRALGTLARMETTGRDVSGQLVDLEARVSSLRAEETRLMALLDEANDVSDILEIRQRLDNVRQQIESLEASVDSLEGQVDYATIHASIHEPGTDDDGDNGDSISDAWDVAWRTATTIVAGAIVIAGIVVPLAVLGIVIWLLVRWTRRRRV